MDDSKAKPSVPWRRQDDPMPIPPECDRLGQALADLESGIDCVVMASQAIDRASPRNRGDAEATLLADCRKARAAVVAAQDAIPGVAAFLESIVEGSAAKWTTDLKQALANIAGMLQAEGGTSAMLQRQEWRQAVVEVQNKRCLLGNADYSVVKRAKDVAVQTARKSLFGKAMGNGKALNARITDADFPADMPQQKRDAARLYRSNMADPLLPDGQFDWLPWHQLVDHYEHHVMLLKLQFSYLCSEPSCNDIRFRFNLYEQWSNAIQPYVTGVEALLQRIVTEKPEHAAVVGQVLEGVGHGATTHFNGAEMIDDWSREDHAFLSARTLITSHYNTFHGRVPDGRPVIHHRDADGKIYGIKWQWAETAPGKPASSNGTPPDQRAVEGDWSPPMTKAKLMERIGLSTIKKFNSFAKLHGIRQAGNRQLWRIRLDGMDAKTRARLEKPA